MYPSERPRPLDISGALHPVHPDDNALERGIGKSNARLMPGHTENRSQWMRRSSGQP